MFNGSFNENFLRENHPSWFDWSFIVLYTSLNESRSLKRSFGLALSFEIISSSIRILLTRITVSIPNPKTYRLCPLSMLLFSCGSVSWRYFIEWAEADDTVPETHTRVCPGRTPPVECGFGARRLTWQALTNQRAGHMQPRFRHAVIWLMLYVLSVTLVTSI